ncbi:MAG: DoxX family protein [Patescibacteria group bacterium]
MTRPMWGLIPLRIAFGTILLLDGAQRLILMRGEAGSFIEELPGPTAVAILIVFSVLQFVGGALIIPGFLSRIVGFVIMIELILSIFFERIPLGFMGNIRMELIMLAVATMMMFSGAGRFSIDRLIARRLLKCAPSKKWEHYMIAETPYCDKWYE